MLRKISKIFSAKNILFRSYGTTVVQNLSEYNVENNGYSYLLILDFEATCDKKFKIEQEIIEFPCLKINAKTLQEESRFHYYVKPVVNPMLTDFCTNLTGILQETVENAPPFPKVLELFNNWRNLENITENNSIYITSGDWDLGCMIPMQCHLSNLEIPQHMTKWIDIKKMYGNNFNNYYNSFAEIMKTFDFHFIGRQHSGIDDCCNIYRVVEKFGKLGLEFKPTSQLVNINNSWKVRIIDTKKFVPPLIWNKKIPKL